MLRLLNEHDPLSKDEARARLANQIEDEMKLPVTIAIAHHLIRDWAAR